jgi:tryptophan-rich sensory protein
MKKLKLFIEALISIALCLSAGSIGSLATMPSIPTWYAGLNKPVFNPPNWIFGPVWTILYILMGISLFLLWQKRKDAKQAIILFLIQLSLNLLWSFMFFGWHWIGLAFVEILFLWLFILLTMIKAYPVSKTASFLLLPYILWVSFASFLNLNIWLLNK